MTPPELEKTSPTFHMDRHLIAGRYRTHTRIGHGRLGEIFAAIDEDYEKLGVEQHVAIQIVPENLVQNNRLFNRINLGFSMLRAAAHPNIVKFLHFGRSGKFGYLVMELLDGASLRLMLDEAEMLPLDEAKPVIRGVGEAVQLLHAKGMVHGDLTTKNVFVTEKLEVRLLDVVPLDSSEMIVRRTATRESFSGCTVEDDVFGLACLAYEMLAGKHPFINIPPEEARSAGLEADRIASLTDREWNALRLALSFDRDQRTSSIAEFMRDFGISGTERLRPTMDQPARHESIEYPAVKEVQPMTRPAAPAHSTAIAAPVAAVDSVGWNEDSPPHARPTRKRARPLRAVFLGTLLAGLGAWSYFGEPPEHIGNLISYIDERTNVGLTEQSDAVVEISTPDSDRSISTDRVASVDRPDATAPAATAETTPSDSEATRPEPERAATAEEVAAALEQPTDQPLSAALPIVENTTESSDEAHNRTADEISADADVNPMQADPESVFTESIVSVSEHDGAVRIVRPSIGYSEATLIWWTSEHTADADKDFMPVDHQTLPDVTVDDGNTLHIPLVNDYLPEPTESFFVNFGFRNSQQGHINRVATLRVDIIDDDFR